MKKVLVPMDFSEASISAFRFAFDIAHQSDGTIALLHVVTLPVIHDSPLMPVAGLKKGLLEELKTDAEDKFRILIQKFHGDKTKIKAHVVTGQIQTMILDYIQKEDADLVIMGTAGASGVREWAIGSNTEKIVRNSSVPIIAVKHYQPGRSIKNIVFPTTADTRHQEDLVMKIKSLQNFFGARLHLISVNTPALFKPEGEIREQLKAFALRYMLKDYSINVFNYTNEEKGILQFTKDIEGDMIAMGTHGYTGLAHLFAGSLAEDVVNHVPYPVWTYSTKSARLAENKKIHVDGR